jgi:hypothetical protein
MNLLRQRVLNGRAKRKELREKRQPELEVRSLGETEERSATEKVPQIILAASI